jgi:hypothetical protein
MRIYWNNVAALAYEKYAGILNRSRADASVPKKPEKWGHLSDVEQSAWIEAVMEACDVYGRAVTA